MSVLVVSAGWNWSILACQVGAKHPTSQNLWVAVEILGLVPAPRGFKIIPAGEILPACGAPIVVLVYNLGWGCPCFSPMSCPALPCLSGAATRNLPLGLTCAHPQGAPSRAGGSGEWHRLAQGCLGLELCEQQSKPNEDRCKARA